MRAYELAGRRSGAGITQAKFAERVGLSERTLREIEQGKVDITYEEYQRLVGSLENAVREREEVTV